MFFLQSSVCRSLVKRSCNRHRSSPGKKIESEIENGDENSKVSGTEISQLVDECANDSKEIRGHVKIGIIGGGMAPIYAALLLKQSRFIKRINIADPNDTLAGAIHDASHIDTLTRIKYYSKNCISDALNDVDIVALMDENDFNMGKAGPLSQFTATSDYVKKMADCMVQQCPSAMVAIFARPVTATLPMVSEIYKLSGWLDPNRIVGSTTIDAMRIESMAACLFDLNPSCLSVPIVGGADPCTVVPLLTRAKPISHFSSEHEEKLIHQLRSADKELLNSASRFKGPSLSTGAAAAKFIISLAAASSGRPNVTCSAYVRSDVLPVCRYFATELLFGRNGIEKNYGLPKASPLAVDQIERIIPYINELSEMAIELVRKEHNK